jgi:hypothetical protein
METVYTIVKKLVLSATPQAISVRYILHNNDADLEPLNNRLGDGV